MNKKEIMAKLEELGIEFDPNATKAELQALLPEAKDEEVAKPKEKPAKGWTPLSEEEMLKAQEAGKLVGWNPVEGLGLLKP